MLSLLDLCLNVIEYMKYCLKMPLIHFDQEGLNLKLWQMIKNMSIKNFSLKFAHHNQTEEFFIDFCLLFHVLEYLSMV
jgi:hypothetical protein